MSTIIKYNNISKNLADGHTATLKCKDKMMLDDVVIESQGGSGSVEFNIAYGDTAPEDTRKLWVKAAEPNTVNVTHHVSSESPYLDQFVAELPNEISQMAAVTVGSKIYILGGYSNSTGGAISDIIIYDVETGELSKSNAMTVTLYAMASAVVGTRIYLFGGVSGNVSTNYQKNIYVYNTEDDSFTQLSKQLPTAASLIAAVTVGTKIYLFGGTGASHQNTIQVFNTENYSLDKLDTTLPRTTHSISACSVGTKIYIFDDLYISNNILLFDTENNSIKTIGTDHVGYGRAAVAIGPKIYLFGGRSNNTYKSDICVYDTDTQYATTLSEQLPNAAYYIAAAAVGTDIYLFGGLTSSGLGIDTVNALRTSIGLSNNDMLIQASCTENMFSLLPSVEIGIKNVYLGNSDGYAEKVPAYLYKNNEWAQI